ncbi:hypothetical protein AV654_12360 [Paenibacillus elgii]|uniref:Uncharacterized protein n=1 Tax=Paenibacillus elgii TaxID=189691 RepID=A0A163YTQ8_9BACL|nr:hypothetical protein [Paenibacillus elgii]KZE80300.1 hypothetical protein AV654_12360 [Paenibacillus elgii]
MSSDKTKRLGLNKWVGSDQVLRAEFNENFDKIDAYIDDSLAVKTTSLQLKQGMQVIDVNQSSPLNNVTIQGRTLVNLLGRTGGFEAGDIAQWLKGAATLTSDTSTFVSGKSSGKMTTTEAEVCYIAQQFTFKKGKYYILIAETKNGTATAGVRIGNNDARSTWNTDATKWTTQFVKVTYEKEDRQDYVILRCSGAAGQTGYIDNYRVYEITRAEYEAIDSMTPEQIAAKWPYVDDMKSVYSPYVIKYGENLLPPFTEWTSFDPGISTAYKPYSYSMTVSNAVQRQNYHHLPTIPKQSYTLSGTFSSDARIGIDFLDANGNFLQTTGFVTTNPLTVTSPIGAGVMRVFTANNATAGTFTFENIMLNLGSIAKSFKPSNDDHLFFPNVNLTSNVDGTVYDTLFQRDGKYWKQAWFKMMDLTGDLKWLRSGGSTGFKVVALQLSNIRDSNSDFTTHKVVKYDGKIIRVGNFTDVINNVDVSYVDGTGLFKLSIPIEDSGWGDSYNPSDDEIRAYFYGWKMGDQNGNLYEGNGQRYWTARNEFGTGTTTTTTVLPTQPNYFGGWKPYKLQYQLVTPTVEEIASEGGITLHEGPNHVEVGTGMIVHERVTPHTDFVSVAINNYSPGWERSRTKYRVGKFFGVYRIALRENWRYDDVATSGGYGGVIAVLSPQGFNAGNPYTVTYLALDQHALSCNVQSIQFERSGNMKSVVDTLAAGQSDMAARVGALEITRAQRSQPQWIEPTLLNGWVNYGQIWHNAGYSKSDLNEVEFIGAVKNTTRKSSIFILPKDFRPSKLLSFVASSHTGTSDITGRIDVYPDGRVDFVSGDTFFVSLNGVRFLAEQ